MPEQPLPAPSEPTRPESTSPETTAAREAATEATSGPKTTSGPGTSTDGLDHASAAPHPHAHRRPLDGRRILRDFLRPRRAQVVLAVALCLVTTAAVLQIRNRGADQEFASLRRDELIGVLDQLNTSNNELRGQISEREATRRRLQSGADSRRVAEQEAATRISELQILSGQAPAQGPGVIITINDPSGKVTYPMLLNAVEELRDAGAEVLDINGHRVVVNTWFANQGDAIVLSGQVLHAPYVISAIGGPRTLEEGARFRGGLVSQVEASGVGANVQISTPDQVTITSTVPAPEFTNAHPK